jgi:hypothetical protein
MLILRKKEGTDGYVLVDGSRGFTSTISGVEPLQPFHLATKWYVDNVTVSGVVGDNYYTKDEILDLLGEHKSGTESLNLGDSSTNVTFNSSFSSSDYALFVGLENTTDSPSSEYAITITNKTVSGFTVHYSGEIDSNKYYLNWLATISGSFSGGDYVTSLIEDTSPQLGGDLDLNDYSVILNTTPSGNFIHGYTIGWSGDISYMSLDDNNGFSSPLYMKSNSNMALCTAASGTTQMPCIALSLQEGTGNKKVLWNGIVRKGSWNWTPGDVIYVSTVEGALTNVKPNQLGNWQQSVGVAISTDTLKFNPGYNPGEIKVT